MKTKVGRKTLKKESHSPVKRNLKDSKSIPGTNRKGAHEYGGYVYMEDLCFESGL